MGEYTIRLESVSEGTDRVGAKAKRLGGMLAAGLPISSAFVITSEAYVKFLRHNKIANKIGGLVEESTSSSMNRLKEISAEIQNLIINGIMPDFIEGKLKEEYQDLSIGREAKEIGGAAFDLIRAGRDNVFVTVRPSPTSAGIVSPDFSGQMKTVVCQRGHSNIVYAIKECWASIFSIRAMLYRKRKRVRDMPAMGVIVQKSIEPEKSGFAYTNQPESGDRSKVVIEGSWGFSDSIISGAVSPDEYVISKETGETVGKKIRKKSWQRKRNEMTGKIEREPVFRERIEADLLDPKETRKIYEMCARVEKHFGGHPQAIEWAEERGRIFVIDSVPVPEMGLAGQPSDPVQGSRELARGICAYRGTLKGKARIVNSMGDTERIEKGDIMITNMTVPEIVQAMDRVSGIITDEGSRSCHAAILAREFGVPCIVLAGNAVSSITEGQEILLNATEGVVMSLPAPGAGFQPVQPTGPVPSMPQGVPGIPPIQQPYREIPDQLHESHEVGISNNPYQGQMPASNPYHDGMATHVNPYLESGPGADNPPVGIARSLEGDDLTATGIKAVISHPGSIGKSPSIADGVGLVKAEHLMTEGGKHPFFMMRMDPEQLITALVRRLGAIAKEFYPKPVWYRSIDVRTDEFRELEGGEEEPTENNPIIGWHGIRRSLDQPELINVEIEVLKMLRKEGLDNIVLGIPFVTGVDELRAVKRLAGDLKVGVMIETPAAGLEIENLCKEGIAFAAVGLNDLAQLTLGVDRENSRISRMYSELNPAVISLLKHIVRTCRKYSVETSVYGEFSGDSRIAERLVEIGVGSISTEPENLEEVRTAILRTERRLILESMRNRGVPGR